VRDLKEGANDVDLVREIVRDACWNIRYHEDRLAREHKKLATIDALLLRTGVTFTRREAQVEVERLYDEDGEEERIDNADAFAKYLVVSAVGGIEHHESALRGAHTRLACVKALILRGNYTEISVDKIAEQARRDHDK
jgi:hypothetical protein